MPLLLSPPAAGAGNAPHTEVPPNFDRLENVAMIIRKLVPAVGFQKFRSEVFRQHHPMRPTRAHALSWSWRPAARAHSLACRQVRGPTRITTAGGGRISSLRRSTFSGSQGDQDRRGRLSAGRAAKWRAREGPPRFLRPKGCPAQSQPSCGDEAPENLAHRLYRLWCVFGHRCANPPPVQLVSSDQQ